MGEIRLAISGTIILICATLAKVIHAFPPPPEGDDGCDKYLWRRCGAQNECDDRQTFKDLSWASPEYGNDPREYPHAWQDKHYENYSRYECKIPPIDGCTAPRCVPLLSSAFDCTHETDCFDGEQCNSGTCGACYETPGYALGACHQPKTSGAGGTPPYEKGQSGCSGDHCLHVCSYDTKCVRISNTTTYIDLTATHNGLGKVTVTDEIRPALVRPGRCGGGDAGGVDGGMRCAAPVHRAVTQRDRTPDTLRGHDDDIVELSIYKNGGWDHYMEFDEDEFQNSSMSNAHHVDIGAVVPHLSTLTGEEGVFVGKGAYAFGLAGWHWGRKGLVTCEVRYTHDAPMHTKWAGIQPDTSLKMSTLQTRVCTRWENKGETVVTFKDHEFGDKDRWCMGWGQSSHFGWTLPFNARCTVSGPNVSHVIPNEEQRDLMLTNISAKYNQGSVTGAPLLRIAFHDAAPYSPKEIGLIKGGPQGCIRFEHIQGNEGNSGLHFTIDGIGPSVGCGRIINNVFQSCPWSVADILQFVGAFASAEMMENNDRTDQLDPIVSDLRWGRHDAPILLCTGELQLAQPDHDGGHLAGFLVHGSSVGGNVTDRLAVTFESTRVYFEDRLGLAPEHWVAILGAHSVGGVRGLIQARNTRFNFDETPNKLDRKYYERLVLAAVTNFASLCPMNKKPGHAHWWGPGESSWAGDGDHWLTLLDTDVAMVLNPVTLGFVKKYASDLDAFLKAFREAFLIIGELGYTEDALFKIPTTATTPVPTPSISDTPSRQEQTHGPSNEEQTPKPSTGPVLSPTVDPTLAPEPNPTMLTPTAAPTVNPTPAPEPNPTTLTPTAAPTVNPTLAPEPNPTTLTPTTAPAPDPTAAPIPTKTPTTTTCGETETEFVLKIKTDGRGLETHFKVVSRNKKGKFNKKVFRTRKFPSNKRVTKNKCVEKNKCYKFVIEDRGEDGICCTHGKGWYKLIIDGEEIKYSRFKKKKESKEFGNC